MENINKNNQRLTPQNRRLPEQKEELGENVAYSNSYCFSLYEKRVWYLVWEEIDKTNTNLNNTQINLNLVKEWKFGQKFDCLQTIRNRFNNLSITPNMDKPVQEYPEKCIKVVPIMNDDNTNIINSISKLTNLKTTFVTAITRAEEEDSTNKTHYLKMYEEPFWYTMRRQTNYRNTGEKHRLIHKQWVLVKKWNVPNAIDVGNDFKKINWIRQDYRNKFSMKRDYNRENFTGDLISAVECIIQPTNEIQDLIDKTNKCITISPIKPEIVDSPNEHDGPVEELGCATTDMPHEEYLRKKKNLLNTLKLTIKEIEEVERKTVGQQNNPEWQKYRKSRLTASNFGKVCKLKATTSRANTVKTLLYNNFQGNSAVRYGNENEPIAKEEFQNKFNISIKPCGLFIHPTLNYLAASPDGLIGNDAIIEVKCPSSIKEYTPKEAVDNKKLKYMVINNGKLILKRNYPYYYQVQGQLNITKRTWCYFVVWTPKGFVVDKISRDEEFWKNDIEPHVTKFFMESLLPEMIDSRFNRGLPIRSSLPKP